MKVLHVISSLDTGGAQKLLSELAPAQKRLGADMEVLVYYASGLSLEKKIENSGIKILSLGVEKTRSLTVLPQLRNALRGVDIGHVHLFPCLYHAAMAATGLQTRLIYTEHSTHNRRRDHRWLRTPERAVYSRYSAIAGISPQTTAALRRWLRMEDTVYNDRFATVPNGIELSAFQRGADTSSDGKTMLMVSRFTEAKDQASVIRSLPMMHHDDVRVVFAGSGSTLGEHRRLAKELGVADRCQFVGDCNNIPELMHGATVGIQASHWEGFGLTAVEFMAAGVPLIASDVPGLSDVADGASLLVKEGDAAAIAEAADQLFDDANLRSRLTEAGYDRARRYDIHNTAAEYLRLYEKILRNRD